MKKKKIIIAICIILAAVIGGIGAVIKTENLIQKTNEAYLQLKIIGTDKAMYSPKDSLKLKYKITNSSDKEIKNIKLTFKAAHLENTVEEKDITVQNLKANEERELEFEWQLPDKDFTGYLLEIGLANAGADCKVLDTIGADVSSSWIKFPRYGYLCHFDKDIDEQTQIEQMNRYHINAIEYYDWQYLHHQPIADGITRENPGTWKDWSGREISGTTIADYIKFAKEKNMVNMAYDMIYAGTDTFFTDKNGNPTKAAAWKLYFAKDNSRGKGNFTIHMGLSLSGNGNLFFVNPLNKEWQEHIFSEILKIFTVFDFDGWHGDTIGEWGKMTTADGGPLGYKEDGTPIYYVKDTYEQFLNAAKDALGKKYLSFNPVGAQGIENANKSKTDVLYTEFWPWDKDRNGMAYDTYASLVREIERSNEDSKEVSFDGKGKSLVVKAYINYYKTSGYMNAPGVLLCNAAVCAAGGSKLELGDGDKILHVEYYPNDDKVLMDDDLKNRMQKMYDFEVAYENLLRDGQKTTNNKTEIEGYNCSSNGSSNSIWTYSRTDGEYEILHLINLLGTDNTWRDEKGKKAAPSKAENLKVAFYTDKEISKIYLCSPDANNCKSSELSFEKGKDENGTYVKFTVPSLEYWDMIYMK